MRSFDSHCFDNFVIDVFLSCVYQQMLSHLPIMRLYQGRLKKSFFKLTCMQFSRCNTGLYYLCPMGLSGLEPPTSRLSGVRSNQLSYKPILEYLIPYRFSNAVFPEPSEQVPRSRESSHASSYTLMSGNKLPSTPVFSSARSENPAWR